MNTELGLITFGPAAPDQPSYNNPGMELVNNCRPILRGYGQLASTATYSSALPERVRGAIMVQDAGGNFFNYAGTRQKLHRLRSTNWEDAGTGFQLGLNDWWDMSQFGAYVVAAAFTDVLQGIRIGGSQFIPIANFRAATATNLRNFVVAANTFDPVDSHQPARVRWSARNPVLDGRPEDFEPSATTLSGFQNLEGEGGRIQRIVGREYGVIFQESSIWRMTYTGQVVGTIPVVWQFDEVERGVGTVAPRSVVEYAGFTAFLARDGFRVFDGNSSVTVAENYIDRTFRNDIDYQYVDRVVGVVDEDDQTIYWAYPGQGHTDGTPNRMVIYRYGVGGESRWSFADEVTNHLYQGAFPHIDMDTDRDAGDIPLDGVAGSLDDPEWKGGPSLLASFNNAHELAFFNGPARDATLRTGEVQAVPGRRMFTRHVRPHIDAPTVTVLVGVRNRQQDPIVWTGPLSVTADGVASTRQRARHSTYEFRTSGAFEEASGFTLYGEVRGGR